MSAHSSPKPSVTPKVSKPDPKKDREKEKPPEQPRPVTAWEDEFPEEDSEYWKAIDALEK